MTDDKRSQAQDAKIAELRSEIARLRGLLEAKGLPPPEPAPAMEVPTLADKVRAAYPEMNAAPAPEPVPEPPPEPEPVPERRVKASSVRRKK